MYPPARTDGPTDKFGEIEVPDPYRWLEDDNDPERVTWIAAQNALVARYLSGLSVRNELKARFGELLEYDRYYAFVRRGPYVLYMHNRGVGQQLVVCARRGLYGRPRVLIDPLTLDPDGTTRVVSFALSHHSWLLGYALSHAGSDWLEYRVKDMSTGKDLPDIVRGIKFAAPAWHGNGFYYSRYASFLAGAGAVSSPDEHHQVWYHRIGTSQEEDMLIYAEPRRPRSLNCVFCTADERFVVMMSRDGTPPDPGTALWLLSAPHQRGEKVLLARSDDDFVLVGTQAGKLLILTNRGAPNWQLVQIDPGSEVTDWKELIPESKDRLESARLVGGFVLAVYSVDGAHRLRVFDVSGDPRGEISLPDCGSVQVFEGQPSDADALYSFSSLTEPTAIYRCHLKNLTSTSYLRPQLRYHPGDYHSTRVFYGSKDGTRIPMFLAHRGPLGRSQAKPLLLYGYGGNGACMTPSFDPLLIALLERDVIFALPCLRGGGEYGEAWHRAGWRDRKQNVFDDCIAALEWLHANGVTKREWSALTGSSNGGLLVGAVLTQRPDLLRVALPDVGVLDMMRFHRFTSGPTWSGEYGTSDDPEMLPVLLAYSPLHNVKPGVKYPATLVTTSEHDDRVVPAHSFKFIATLQSKGGGPGPYLIRIDTKSGHGPASLSKLLAERADVYGFMLMHLGTS